jgi:hypothetical protein
MSIEANEIKKKARIPLGAIIGNNTGVRVLPLSTHTSREDTVQQSCSTHVSSLLEKHFTHTEIPIGDQSEPQDVVDFEHIVYRSLRDRELAAHPIVFRQTEITLRDRNLIIDAIDRFHYKLALTTNTLYRFIGILDRFLSVVSIPKGKLEVYGCSAFLIASKVEDVRPALSTELIELSGSMFSQSELFSAETEVINAIQFDTTFATALFMLTQISRIYPESNESALLSRYILELCQTHERFYGLSTALLASLALMIARILMEKERWPLTLALYTGHREEDLNPLADVVHAILLDTGREECRFIRRKYGSDLFLRVADIFIPETFR